MDFFFLIYDCDFYFICIRRTSQFITRHFDFLKRKRRLGRHRVPLLQLTLKMATSDEKVDMSLGKIDFNMLVFANISK